MLHHTRCRIWWTDGRSYRGCIPPNRGKSGEGLNIPDSERSRCPLSHRPAFLPLKRRRPVSAPARVATKALGVRLCMSRTVGPRPLSVFGTISRIWKSVATGLQGLQFGDFCATCNYKLPVRSKQIRGGRFARKMDKEGGKRQSSWQVQDS